MCSVRFTFILCKDPLKTCGTLSLIAEKEGRTNPLLDGVPVADPEGVCEGRSNPPLKQNYFIFMENFQKNQEKKRNNQVKVTNRTRTPYQEILDPPLGPHRYF